MKRKTSLHGLLAAILMTCAAPSFAVYKCETNGKVSYSDTECAGGRALDISAAPAADAAAASQQTLREKRVAEQLATTRARREARDEKERQKTARAATARAAKCGKLARRQKWADEDAAAATGKAAEAVRRKARRAAEEHQAECGPPNALGIARQ